MGKPKMCKNHLFIKYLHSLDNMTLHLLQGDTIHVSKNIGCSILVVQLNL